MWQTLIVFAARVVLWPWRVLGLYSAWCGLYRWVFERRAKGPLTRYASLEALARQLKAWRWRADGLKQLGDAVSRPEETQNVGEGDCDDFACYSASALVASLADGTMPPTSGVVTARILSSIWWAPGRGFSGHAVCEVVRADGSLQAMDYGLPYGNERTQAELAAFVRMRFGGPHAVCVMWIEQTPELGLISWGW